MESKDEFRVELVESELNDKSKTKGTHLSLIEEVNMIASFISNNHPKLCHFLQSPLFFFTNFIMSIYGFVRFIALCKIESFFLTILVVFFLILFVFVESRLYKKVSNSNIIFVTLVACITTNILVETVQKSSIVKKTANVTIFSNLYPLLLFSPGALDLRFSPFYLVAITTICEFHGLVQYYSYLFRGLPFRPIDLTVLDGAFQMRHDYSIVHPEGLAFMAVAIANVVCTAYFAFGKNVNHINKKVRYFVALICGLLFSFFSLGFSIIMDVLTDNEIIVTWDLPVLYPGAGNLLGFYVDFRGLSSISVPAGYNAKTAEEILSHFKSNKPVDLKKIRRPHIIAIMSESFADFKILGNFTTNQDYMPFIRNLKNSVKGYVSVTAYGGHSCNSEYEFLTGNSVSFLRYGTNAYGSITNERQEVLSYILNDYGYDTIACACTDPIIWHIGDVYKQFKFNETFFAEQYYKKTKNHNGRVLDSIVFDAIIKLFNERHEDKPLFFFLATMQNHANYAKLKDPTVYAEEYKDMGTLSSYLTGIKMTDDAVKNLIGYFSKVKDDVVIAFYGDHNPHFPAISLRRFGKEKQDLPLLQRNLFQFTPYFIWANYPIKQQREDISLTYLSSKVMEIAGLPKTAYMKFLDDTKKHVPMITPFSYMDSNKKWYWRKNKTAASAYIDRYIKVQQYMIFDSKKKN